MSNKLIKDMVDTKYFEFPCNKIKSKFLALKYHLNSTKLPANNAELFICNKTSEFDKYFVNDSLEGFYVILKDEYIQKIYNKTITYEEQVGILKNVEQLRTLMVSIVVFPEKNITVFGDTQKIPKEIIEFLLGFEMDIKFLYLIGSYFINPVWTNEKRVCETKTENKFTITYKDQKILTFDEIMAKFNKYMPSSACTYAKKIPVYIRSNRCAENLEKILYTCPNCNYFFSLFSEYSLVKCGNCETAFEISPIDSEINLTKTFTSLESAKEFQFNFLKTQDLVDDKKILSYEGLNYLTERNKKQVILPCNLSIYCNKIEYEVEGNTRTLNFFEVFDIYLTAKNTLIIEAFNFKTQRNYQLEIQGTKKENLYILVDLLEIYEERDATPDN